MFLALDPMFAILLQVIFGLIQASSVDGNMQNHFHAQRYQSLKLFAAQLSLALMGVLFWGLIEGYVQGMAFALGVLAIAFGQLAQSLVSFSGGIQGAKIWFGRFLMASLLKWLVVITILAFCIDSLQKAPLALLLGVVISLFIIQLFNFFDVKVKRGS